MKKTMSVAKAYTLARFFGALEVQIEIAFRQGRTEDALSLCRLKGKLLATHFGFVGSLFDRPADYVEAA